MNDTILLYISAVCSVIAIIVLLVDWVLDLRAKKEDYITGEELVHKLKRINKKINGDSK